MQYGVGVAAGRAFVSMSAVLQGAADRVQGVRQHGVVLLEGDGGQTGGIDIVIGIGGAVEEANITRTDHAMFESFPLY